MGYKGKNKKEFHHEIVELESDRFEYKEPYKGFKSKLNQDEQKPELLIPKKLFSNIILVNMVQIE